MARTRSTFCCPNCFSQFQKDDSVLMLSSGAAVSGEGIGWSGKLDRYIDRIKRVKYCKRCRQPLDFHALLQGTTTPGDHHGWRSRFCSCSPRPGSGSVIPFGRVLAWQRSQPRLQALPDRGSNASGSRVGVSTNASWRSSPCLRLLSVINSDDQVPPRCCFISCTTLRYG